MDGWAGGRAVERLGVCDISEAPFSRFQPKHIIA